MSAPRSPEFQDYPVITVPALRGKYAPQVCNQILDLGQKFALEVWSHVDTVAANPDTWIKWDNAAIVSVVELSDGRLFYLECHLEETETYLVVAAMTGFQ